MPPATSAADSSTTEVALAIKCNHLACIASSSEPRSGATLIASKFYWQAARSGKQNIIEGSMASGTSMETEIKLTGVARSSLEELLADYHDFLRVQKLTIWEKNSPEAQEVRRLGVCPNASYALFEHRIERGTAEIAANAIITLIY